MEPQKPEEGEFTDLEGLDLTSKLELLRRNEQWKCQVKKEALEVRFGLFFRLLCVCLSVGTDAQRKREREMGK